MCDILCVCLPKSPMGLRVRLTVDLQLADEGLGEVRGHAGGDACCGLQRWQEGHVGHLRQMHYLMLT